MIKYFNIILLLTSCIYSQDKANESIIIYIDTPNQDAFLSISIDTTDISFAIYKKGFETKALRDREFEKYKKKDSDIIPPIGRVPSFSYNFAGVGHPEKLSDLKTANYLTVKQFRNNPHFPRCMFLIYKVKEGHYLKWKLSLMPNK